MILCSRRRTRTGIMRSGLGQSHRIGRAPGPSGFHRLAVILCVSTQVGDTHRPLFERQDIFRQVRDLRAT